MKKTDLLNCPDWLMEAETINEDVEFINEIIVWKSGTFKSGTWKYGFKRIGFCKWPVYYNSVTKVVKIGCKQDIVSNWIAWFQSDQTFDTPRNTPEFKLISNSFLLAKLAIELEQINQI